MKMRGRKKWEKEIEGRIKRMEKRIGLIEPVINSLLVKIDQIERERQEAQKKPEPPTFDHCWG